jgi:hypothetical protein
MNRIILAALTLALAAMPATAQLKPSPPAEEYLAWRHWYLMYRGQSVINVEDQLNKATDALRRKGWCYGDGLLPASEWTWHRCDMPDAMEIIGGSKRVDALPFSPSAEAIDSELGEDQL